MSKILLVTDSETHKELIIKTLAKSSNTIISSTDENAVLSYVEKSQVDMVIVDDESTSIDVLIL